MYSTPWTLAHEFHIFGVIYNRLKSINKSFEVIYHTYTQAVAEIRIIWYNMNLCVPVQRKLICADKTKTIE